MKDFSPRAFGYGYPMPLLMVSTYDENGTVNVMNLHWCTMNHGGYINLGVGTNKKTHENIEKMGAFTVALATQNLMKEADFFGSVSGYRDTDKFAKTGLKATKSKYVNAPIIKESNLVIECELTEIVRGNHIHAIVGKMVNIAVDESVLNEKGKIDAKKTGMLFFDSFSNGYFTLGDKIGNAWNEGRTFMTLNR
ncbi:flavin reductase family protein [Paenibacillus sp. FSL H8-0537]|uniref:flavin reductase family protein n=1 Tax=Paenibacillus sp. FSL H8-0537 TaxID=2921399 RepID=UPI003100DC2F